MLRNWKKGHDSKKLQMLTCYDYQTALMLSETPVDLILVGDSVGNVVLGYENTIRVTLEEMITFSSAVKRGAPEKFIIADLPFGSFSNVYEGIKNTTKIFKESGVEAVKIEGAFPLQLELIKNLTHIGIPVMGHIGLTPQSVHEQGGYFTHGKNQESKEKLIKQAYELESAGVFSIVLECVDKTLAKEISASLDIPTIGIGSGEDVDGQVLVINDLLGMGNSDAPSFVTPIADLYNLKKELILNYLGSNSQPDEREEEKLVNLLNKELIREVTPSNEQPTITQ